MISFIRSFFKSKLGIAVTLAFLALIAFAFASSDVSNTGTFGGIAGGNRVAIVGDETVSSTDLTSATNSAFDSVRRNNPTLSMPAFIEQGGLDDVVDQLLERISLSVFAQDIGLRAGDNLVNSEIIKIPAFRGADGNFDQQTYLAALRQNGLNDQMMREDLASGLLAQQLLVPAAFGAKMPQKMANQYASLLKESRQGAIGLVLSAAYAPAGNPTDAQLNAFYSENRGNYIRPERRVIRYATFTDAALGKVPPPTDKEIAAYYEKEKEEFAPSETRTVSQLIVPTEQAANSIRNRLNAGGSLDQIAKDAGLSVAKVGPVTRENLGLQTSSAVATAVFQTKKGDIAVPARSGLGFHIVRVDQINRSQGRNLAQARSDIIATLTAQKRQKALSDLAASTEDMLQEGSLNETARELGLEIKTTQPVTAAGQVYGSQTETIPQLLAPALQTAFEMEESEPELAELEPGKTFLVFEVSEITPSAAAPLNEIRDQVAAAWKLEQGSAEAKKAADRIMGRMEKGMSLSAAMGKEDKRLPPVDSVNLSRQQLAQQGQQVPAPIALLFSMAEGTTKRLEAPQNAGWFIVDLDTIKAGTVAKDDPLLVRTQQELSLQLGREYADQLRLAISQEIDVERNDEAIEAVRKQLAGEN